MVELRHLRYFLAVVEEKSFTRAAVRLHVSQPTLSQQIRALERSIGHPLFDRLPGGPRLTPAGHVLVEPADRAIMIVADGVRSARESALAATGDLRVGMIYAAAGALTQSVLSAFAAAFPDVRLHFRGELPVARAYTALARDEVDVAFTRLPLDPARHAWHVLYRERRVVVAHESNPLSDARTVSLSDVLPLPILSARPSRTPPEVEEHWLLNDFRNGTAPERYVTDAWTVPEIAQTLVHNPAVIAMCSEIARSRPPIPDAPLLFIDLPEAGLSEAVIARRESDRRPHVTAFCDVAVAVARGLPEATPA
ncbi:LysR family cyn operon transcriptional activator [Saccharothrix saharensis]|uniref:LysR family cyn operon transcriptional activator n=1 Tax=Saccharothrix saharensis TaxID=571190 RepID=A0A543JRK4_9PSEU|nr:LysR family transcriptional regulator [Saccharothrix saharensis]TQM85384.1 LysR family cyn operon transcriptional activator [Saccharothrix saharensis]